jgi:hypothetical protein
MLVAYSIKVDVERSYLAPSSQLIVDEITADESSRTGDQHPFDSH